MYDEDKEHKYEFLGKVNIWLLLSELDFILIYCGDHDAINED